MLPVVMVVAVGGASVDGAGGDGSGGRQCQLQCCWWWSSAELNTDVTEKYPVHVTQGLGLPSELSAQQLLQHTR